MIKQNGAEDRTIGRAKGIRQTTSLGFTGVWGITAAFTVLLIIFSTHTWYTSEAEKASMWVAHTYEVGTTLKKLLSILQDAETGQRGYLLTGNEAYLEPFFSANKRIDNIVSEIRDITSDNPRQFTLIGILTSLIAEKLNELEKTISLRRANRAKEALAIVRSDQGKLVMDRIRSVIAEMESEETALLELRRGDLEKAKTLSLYGEVVAVTFLIGIAVIVVHKIRSVLYLRKRAEANIQKLNEDLERRVDERTSELHHLSGRLISAQEEERSRIARELHDDFNQRMALLALDLERLHDVLPDSQEGLVDGLASLLERTKELSSDIHRLSRQLHPSILQHLGLVTAVSSFCAEISEQHDIHVELDHHDVPHSLSTDIALCLYRIVQEALRNVIKHSSAESVRVEITGNASELKLQVSDDGIGFDPDSDNNRRGLGLLSMRERLRQVDGTISIMRIKPTGTRIDIRIPFSESN